VPALPELQLERSLCLALGQTARIEINFMATYDDFKQSKYLTKGDVGKGMLLTINGWHEENVAMSGAKEEIKPCVDFVETPKPLVLNSTKNAIIMQICGTPDFDQWTGTQIVAFHDPNIMNRGQVVGGISVRARRIVPTSAPAPVPVTRAPAPVRPMPVPPIREPAAEAGVPPEDDDVPF
jgi:hypothetical protein